MIEYLARYEPLNDAFEDSDRLAEKERRQHLSRGQHIPKRHESCEQQYLHDAKPCGGADAASSSRDGLNTSACFEHSLLEPLLSSRPRSGGAVSGTARSV